MLIDTKELNHWINHFYGYGSWHARIWFVAFEDGGGDLPEEVAEKLSYFYHAHAQHAEPTLCDIRALYRNCSFRWDGPKADIYANLFEYRFGNNAIVSGVWKNLIAFVQGYKDAELPDMLNYQKHSLASLSTKNEALIKLFPLPSPHHHAWYYSWLDLPQFPFLKSRTLYQEHVYTDRIRALLDNMKAFRPEVVLLYGMNNINLLKTSVQESFPGVVFKTVKAIKQKIPQHHRADINGTVLLITTQIPALRHNRVETGFDWEAFGKKVRDETSVLRF